MLERKACLVGQLEAQKTAERQEREEERDPFSSPLDEKVSLERKGDGRVGGKRKKVSSTSLLFPPPRDSFFLCAQSWSLEQGTAVVRRGEQIHHVFHMCSLILYTPKCTSHFKPFLRKMNGQSRTLCTVHFLLKREMEKGLSGLLDLLFEPPFLFFSEPESLRKLRALLFSFLLPLSPTLMMKGIFSNTIEQIRFCGIGKKCHKD